MLKGRRDGEGDETAREKGGGRKERRERKREGEKEP